MGSQLDKPRLFLVATNRVHVLIGNKVTTTTTCMLGLKLNHVSKRAPSVKQAIAWANDDTLYLCITVSL